MKQTLLVAHLSIPALVTLGAFTVALQREPFGMEMFAAYVLGGYLFYAAPHLLWAVVAALAKFSGAVWHAGFVASSIALAAIASLWLGPADPSGLPLQWMLYLAVGSSSSNSHSGWHRHLPPSQEDAQPHHSSGAR